MLGSVRGGWSAAARDDRRMKIYADTGSRRTRQIVWDVGAVLIIAFWIWVGVQVHDAIAQLGAVGTQMEHVGSSLNGDLTSMADTLGNVPLIGSGIRAPFESAANAATSIQEAGTSQRETVNKIATISAISLVLAPIVAVLSLWLIPRITWMVRVARLAAVASAPGGTDLLALRALTRRPMAQLLAIHPDPAAAWRAGDAGAVTALAALERRAVGLS